MLLILSKEEADKRKELFFALFQNVCSYYCATKILIYLDLARFLEGKKTDFDTLTSFCPKIPGLSQQNGKEIRQFLGMRAEKGVSLHQKSFFIRNIYHLVGF